MGSQLIQLVEGTRQAGEKGIHTSREVLVVLFSDNVIIVISSNGSSSPFVTLGM